MFITGVGTAAPPRRYSQGECWEAVQRSPQFQKLTLRSRGILRKVLTGSSGIEARHLALDRLEDGFDLTPDSLHGRFARTAPRLASQAAAAALQDASVAADQVDALLVSTCTGYLCPGLSSYVAELLGLRPDVLGLDLVGQGCVAALPNLRAAEALLKSGRSACVLSVCVEICSAAIYFDNDPGVLISACLFGDGAGAVVLNSKANGKRPLEWLSCGSVLEPAKRDFLRFEMRGGMLRNVLALQVPTLAAAAVRQVLDSVLDSASVPRDQIAAWLLHTGGREVLKEIGEKLALTEADLAWSASVLREFGNVSSPSVIFSLKAALTKNAPAGYWWLSSFGAGFSCHGALLKAG